MSEVAVKESDTEVKIEDTADPLAAARGIVIGFAICAPVWAALIWAFFGP